MSATKDKSINIRTSAALESLVTHACSISGLSKTTLVSDAIKEKVEEIIIDRRFHSLSPAKFKKFQEALNGPFKKNPNLVKTLSTEKSWEEILQQKK